MTNKDAIELLKGLPPEADLCVYEGSDLIVARRISFGATTIKSDPDPLDRAVVE